MRFSSILVVFLALIVTMFPGAAQAQDAAVEQLEVEVGNNRDKTDGNRSRIQIIEDAIVELQNGGVEGPQGPMGPQGPPGISANIERRNVDSFQATFVGNDGVHTLATLDADTGFVITDVMVRAFNLPTNISEASARFEIESGGSRIFYAGIDPFGRILPGEGKQDLFNFESGVVVPRGGDISVDTFSTVGIHDFTIMGYYY